MYLHGRTKDLSPILVLDFKLLGELLKKKQIDSNVFNNLHNFISHYAMNNMMVPGQVERWTTYLNLNKFPLKSMPIGTFKACAGELGCNFIDYSQKTYIVNATMIQTVAGKILQKFLDAETVAKQFISSKPNDKKII